jgi:molecular chaperone GrpE
MATAFRLAAVARRAAFSAAGSPLGGSNFAAPALARAFSRSAAWRQAEGKPAAGAEQQAPPAGEGQQAAAGAAAAVDPVKALQEEVAKLKAAVGEERAARLRVLAEMENVRTIAKRDVAQAKDYALQSFAKSLLNVVDNLGRAVEAVPPAAREKKAGNEAMAVLYEGVAATEREFQKILGQAGITPFGKVGEPFDYNKHEALLQVPAPAAGVPANTVAQVLKVGYTLKDRTLRVAQVAIAVEAPPA